MQLTKPTNSTICIGIHLTQTVIALIKSYNWSNQHGQQRGQLLEDIRGTSAVRKSVPPRFMSLDTARVHKFCLTISEKN